MRNYFNDPAGIELARINKIYGLDRRFNVKAAAAQDDTPSFMDYAYPDKMLFPVDTPERTTLSWCYAKESRDIPASDRDRVLGAIKQAADFWEIELPEKEVEAEEPSASVTLKIACDGRSLDVVVESPENMAQLVALLRKNANDYSYDTRQQLAEQILAAPDAVKTRLTHDDIPFLQKVAGDMLVTTDDIRLACATRAMLIARTGHKDLADIVKEAGETTPAEGIAPKAALIKISRLLDYATRAVGLKTGSDHELLPIELSYRGIPESEVRRFTNSIVSLKNGSAVVKHTVVENRTAVDEFFGKIAGEDVSKMDAAALFNRIAAMDDVEADAFTHITGLTIQ